MTSVQFFPLYRNHSTLTSIVPDIAIEGDEEDDHVVHGPADAEGLGVVVQTVATCSIRTTSSASAT